MSLNESDKEWIEGIIVRHHEGRMVTTSQLFREFGDILKGHTETLEGHDKKLGEIEKAIEPFTAGLLAGKLSYMFLMKALGLVSLVGGVVLLFKNLEKS